MKRALLALAVVAGAFASTAPAASAAPLCGTLVGVRCFNGSRVCLVWIGPTGTCL